MRRKRRNSLLVTLPARWGRRVSFKDVLDDQPFFWGGCWYRVGYVPGGSRVARPLKPNNETGLPDEVRLMALGGYMEVRIPPPKED